MAVKCWAESLGGCVEAQSREHVVSQSIFTEDVVTVHGLPWCKDKPKVIGLAGATAKTLCRVHNSGLSELDAAAGEFYTTMRAALRLSGERRKLMPWITPVVQRFRVDAARLERWLLKTLININDQQPARFQMDSEVLVPHQLVEICFGRAAFPGHAGLYFASHLGMEIDMADNLKFSPLTEDDHLIGGLFTLHGLRLLLWLDARRPPPNLSIVGAIEPDWAGTGLHRRLANFKVMHGVWPSHFIDFDWSAALLSEG